MEESVKINGVDYVPASSVTVKAQSVDGMDAVIIRTYSAGVFAGYLKGRIGKEVELVNARRLWYWDGAASLSQLAMEGTKTPEKCKFAMPVTSVILTEAIEILPLTTKAIQSISEVSEWKQ